MTTALDQLDRHIDEKEKVLARIQTEGTRTCVEANLAREGRQSATNTLFAIACAAKEILAVPMDEHLEQLRKDLFG